MQPQRMFEDNETVYWVHIVLWIIVSAVTVLTHCIWVMIFAPIGSVILQIPPIMKLVIQIIDKGIEAKTLKRRLKQQNDDSN